MAGMILFYIIQILLKNFIHIYLLVLRIKESGSNHFVGDVVRFSCNRNFQLLGQSEITCMENGTWSFSAPQCKINFNSKTKISKLSEHTLICLGQMFCNNPGSPTSGYIVPENTIYEIGALVKVICNPGFKLQGRKWLTCQQDGLWSSSLGFCISDR